MQPIESILTYFKKWSLTFDYDDINKYLNTIMYEMKNKVNELKRWMMRTTLNPR